MRILYVEDDAADAGLTQQALARSSDAHDVEAVGTLAEARERLRNPSRYDLLLCDIRLPDGDGLSLLEHVRARRLPIAVVILTGAGEERDAITALTRGADDYILKNSEDWQHLADSLESAVRRRRIANESARSLRVLYVDDSDLEVQLTRRALAESALKFQIDSVSTGEALMMRLQALAGQRLPWDVLLIDYRLPGRNGLELVKAIREDFHLDVPIVIVTGHGAEDIAAQALRLGVTHYISKHDGYLDELAEALERAIDRAHKWRRERELRDAMQQLNHMLSAHSTVLFRMSLVDGQPSPTALWVSSNVTSVLGYSVEEARDMGGLVRRAVPGEDLEELLASFPVLLKTGQHSGVFRIRHKNGSLRWMQLQGRMTTPPGDPNGEFVSSWNDITEIKEYELKLAESEAKFRAMAETMEDVIWQATPEMIYTYVSPSIERQRGFKPAEMVGRSVFDFVPAGARPVLEKKFLEAIRARTEGHPQPTRPVEFEHATRDGRSIWIESLISPILRDGQLLGYQGVSRDVTARKVLEARMDFLTHNDALTGLPNRKLFEIRLEHALQSAISFHQKMAILLIDLDHFKNINDSLGHTTGDELLKTVAQRLSRTLRSGDTLARLGGDEFAVLLEHVERSEDVSRVAQDLLDALEHVMTLPNGTELDVGASLGISLYPDHAQSAGELLQYADSALYRAKAEGRRTFRYFSEELTHAARERLSLESQLRHAIARDELAVYYQPIVDIRSGAIVGAEALLRWHCADGQLIMPDRFIPIAEESNLILPIGEWVLRTACAQVQNWSKEGEQPLFIAVNLSPKQFVQRDLADQIQAILRETRLAPSRLELEITESAMMPEGENAGVLLDRLKSTGVSLAIDDFGTGYSSLSYLQRFPFDTLKIDRRFVQNVTERRDDIIIVNSIIRLAQSLNYTLLAEGVETEAQLEFLRNQGCNLYQGFLCSKAVPAEEFTQLLQRQARGRAA